MSAKFAQPTADHATLKRKAPYCRSGGTRRRLHRVGQKPGAKISVEHEQRRPLLVTILPIAPENPFMPLLEVTPPACAIFVTDPDDSVQELRSTATARNYV